MEMSIEEAHGILSNGLVNAPSEHEWFMAFKMAIDTMHKYQKIEEIVNTWRHDITVGDYHCMAEVAEVVEDGNDD